MARVTWNIHENTFSKTCWIGFYTMPKSLFPSQAVKTGLCLSFYHRKGQWIQDFCGSFAICAELPWEGRGAIHHHASSQLRAAPAPSAWWPEMLAASAEGWDLCPCLLFLQTWSGPEQWDTGVFYVPFAPAARCQPAEFMAALPLRDKRSHKSPNSFAGSQ